MSEPLDLSYPALQKLMAPLLGRGRTESRAFLAWFLQDFYRLEPDAAQDAVCDGTDDKGIDGIYVDDNLETVDVFQSKVVQNPKRTLGDSELKRFAGTLTLFAHPGNVQNIAATTQNAELRNLILNQEVPKKLANGYSYRGVLITNTSRDPVAAAFLSTQPNIVLYDAPLLRALFVPSGPVAPIAKPATFDVPPRRRSTYSIAGTKVVVAPLKATQLVKLDGVASGALFAWNVRQALGRTKVNKQIAASVEEPAEHANFLLYHNGLTILCREVSLKDNKLTISGYMVVNGCQSLTTLYDHRDQLTSDLELLVRLIQLEPDDPLAAKITHHSNNQNPINARDLQSNSVIQRRLQRECEAYDGSLFYAIKRGETPTGPLVIDNEDAARILLAFDLEEPWTCHQTYKLFDELHSPIFARPEVTAKRIHALSLVFDEVLQAIPAIEHTLMAGYRLTRYFLLYLFKRAIAADPDASRFCRDPGAFLAEPNGHNRIRAVTAKVVKDLVIDLNAELNLRESSGNPIDYKRELKSPTAVRALERSIIPPYQMAVSRGRASSFSGEWQASSPQDG